MTRSIFMILLIMCRISFAAETFDAKDLLRRTPLLSVGGDRGSPNQTSRSTLSSTAAVRSSALWSLWNSLEASEQETFRMIHGLVDKKGIAILRSFEKAYNETNEKGAYSFCGDVLAAMGILSADEADDSGKEGFGEGVNRKSRLSVVDEDNGEDVQSMRNLWQSLMEDSIPGPERALIVGHCRDHDPFTFFCHLYDASSQKLISSETLSLTAGDIIQNFFEDPTAVSLTIKPGLLTAAERAMSHALVETSTVGSRDSDPSIFLQTPIEKGRFDLDKSMSSGKTKSQLLGRSPSFDETIMGGIPRHTSAPVSPSDLEGVGSPGTLNTSGASYVPRRNNLQGDSPQKPKGKSPLQQSLIRNEGGSGVEADDRTPLVPHSKACCAIL